MKVAYRKAIALFILFSFKEGACQVLKPGSKMPEYIVGNVMQYSSDELALVSAFSGKHIILDFWNHSCISCIQSFRKIDSLQKKFGERLQFILVNRESKDSTMSFFELRKRIKPPSVPLVTNDSVLGRLFPHTSYPFAVWIDKKGMVKYLGAGREISLSNIEKFLNEVPIKSNGENKKIVYSPLMNIVNNERNSGLVYYSYISRCVPGVDVGYASLMPEGTGVRLSYNCGSIADLYKKAYSEHYKYSFDSKGSVILNVKDPYRYSRPENMEGYDEWEKTNSYCYDLLISKEKAAIAYKIMQEDLSRYFDLEVCREKRMVRSLVLEKKEEGKLGTQGGKPFYDLYFSSLRHPTSDNFRYLRNIPFETFINNLKANIPYYTGLLFFDETGYRGNVDMSFSIEAFEPFDIEIFRKDLNRYGLDLVEKEREIDVLVISEKK